MKYRVSEQGTANDAIRYASELQAWYMRLFAAARAGKRFDEPRPQPKLSKLGPEVELPEALE